MDCISNGLRKNHRLSYAGIIQIRCVYPAWKSGIVVGYILRFA